MAKLIHPKAFLIAETRVDEHAISDALKHLGNASRPHKHGKVF